MNELLDQSAMVWAIILVIALPLVLVGVGELEERLRQRDSVFTNLVGVIRRWTIPLFAFWAILIGLFALDSAGLGVRVVGTALLLSVAGVALAIVRIVVSWFRRRALEGERRRPPELLLAMPRVVVILVAGWMLLDGVWGVDLSAALTALGVTSLVVSFALQDTLSGLASGMLLLSDAPFQPGDWIRVEDLEGKVVDINWRSSRIQTRDGDLVVVPNATLASGTVVNYDRPERVHRVVVPVQVAYVNPPTLAKEMLLDAARSTPGVLEEPPPAIRVVQIDDPLMGYEAQMWIADYTDAPRVKSDFGSLVWYMSHRHDVPLPSPAYDLYVYDGVQAGVAGIPDKAEIRRRLRSSVLIDQLNDDDLDRLVAAAQPVRYARGETIIESGAVGRELYVLWTGTARIVVGDHDGGGLEAAEITEGDLFGLLTRTERWPLPPRVVAITDCEVVVIDETVAGEVASRNPALSDALNQIMATRRRRIERMLESVELPSQQRASADHTGEDRS